MDQELGRRVAIKILDDRHASDDAVRGALPARGAERRRALAPEHRLDLRPRRLGGHLLHRDGVRRGADAEGAARRARPVAARDRDRLHAPDPLGAALRAPERDRAPRHQAAQRDRRRRGPGQGDGLRDRARRRREPDDRGRLDHRHGAVPLPRAGARRPRRPDVRPLLDRDRPLRAADRLGALHRRDPGRDRDEAPLAGARRLPPRTGRRCRATSTTSSCARSPRTRPTATTRPRRWTPISSGSRAGSASPPRRPRRRRPSSPAPTSREAPTTIGPAAPPPTTTYTPGRYYEYDEPPRRRSFWPWLLGAPARRRRARRRLVRLPGVPVPAQRDEARGRAGREGLAGAARGQADQRRGTGGADHPRGRTPRRRRATSSSRIRSRATRSSAATSSPSSSRPGKPKMRCRTSSARAATMPSRTLVSAKLKANVVAVNSLETRERGARPVAEGGHGADRQTRPFGSTSRRARSRSPCRMSSARRSRPPSRSCRASASRSPGRTWRTTPRRESSSGRALPPERSREGLRDHAPGLEGPGDVAGARTSRARPRPMRAPSCGRRASRPRWSRRSSTTRRRDGKVLSQDPEGGTEAEEGTTVVIVVGRFEAAPPPEPPPPTTTIPLP